MSSAETPAHKPFVPPEETPPEFTLAPVLVGAVLGIVFGASSVYLVLKVGLTVSASIPVAVMAITLFRAFTSAFGLRRTTILENNIVQTTGSAGESIAFGVGLTMPALLLLGFDIDVVRVMTVGVLGGLLGILMMIPLRRAFIVKQHGTLMYPEGTACADVLIAGEKGGATAGMVFAGFGLGFLYQFAMKGLRLWKDEPEVALYAKDAATGVTTGLKGGYLGAIMEPALLGVGYIIGPRIASIMVAGGVLAYLVLVPAIVFFGEGLEKPLLPAISKVNDEGVDVGLIRNMSAGQIRNNYILYIGAGAVAAGGIIAMLRALPVIVSSVVGGVRDFAAERSAASTGAVVPRTERDLPMSVVLFGSVGMVVALAAAPSLGLGFSAAGLAGAGMILLFGFLFVTVSSRLTGEIGSSSNPISGMTVATLLLTCLLLLVLSQFGVLEIGKDTKLLALTVAAVVCIASSNGGTTSQALKTGYLVGATPKWQQYAILIGSLTSALVVGLVLLGLNQAGTVYTKKNLPAVTVDVTKLTGRDHVRTGPYADDATEYAVLNVGEGEGKTLDESLFKSPLPAEGIPAGRYFVNADGAIVYLADPAVNGKLLKQDDGTDARKPYDAPKTQLIALIINGILERSLPWDLVVIGVLIAVTLELAGVPSLPFAVGVYLPLSASTPIFVGGMIRWTADKVKGGSADGTDADTSPGVLLSSGYIAGGAIAAVLLGFLAFDLTIVDALDQSKHLKKELAEANWTVTLAFAALGAILFAVGTEKFGRKK